jgi:hypothetical protein
MSGLLHRIGEMLGMGKKPSTTPDPTTTAPPSSTRVVDEDPDAAPTDVEDTGPNDPRNDTPTE